MIIYEADTEGNDYYNPIQQVGIYSDLEHAKTEVEEYSQYLEKLRVYVLALQGTEYKKIKVWEKDKNQCDSKWEIVTHS